MHMRMERLIKHLQHLNLLPVLLYETSFQSPPDKLRRKSHIW